MKYRVNVLGLGLIGGSMAIDLKRRGFADTVTGIDVDSVNAETAKSIGIVDNTVSYDQCADNCDLLIVAVPAGTAAELLPDILDRIGRKQGCMPVVMDVCSTKSQIAESVWNHPVRGRFVATHPMAGTEYSGPLAAMSGLFDGKATVVCDSSFSDKDALDKVGELYGILNMRQIEMDALNHDKHVAYVSHISHITSFALALTVLKQEKSDSNIFDLASGGFSSTVRLAKSNADMWVPVLLQNSKNVNDVLETYMGELLEFKKAIISGDGAKLKMLINEANNIRRILK